MVVVVVVEEEEEEVAEEEVVEVVVEVVVVVVAAAVLRSSFFFCVFLFLLIVMFIPVRLLSMPKSVSCSAEVAKVARGIPVLAYCRTATDVEILVKYRADVTRNLPF